MRRSRSAPSTKAGTKRPHKRASQLIFPIDTHRNEAGHLVIGGCDVVDLVKEYGSPLYVYDEATIRTMCRLYLDALGGNYPNSSVTYAGKAYIDPTLLQIVADEGLGLDAVSGGEIQCAVASGFPMEDRKSVV